MTGPSTDKTFDQIVASAAVYVRDTCEHMESRKFPSPIEFQLATGLAIVSRLEMSMMGADWVGGRTENECKEFVRQHLVEPPWHMFLFHQVKIQPYTVDFLLMFLHPFDDSTGGVIAECDGHDFHERTKEQAAHDKKRDRFLQSKGYKVLRFTGSEIWKDPCGCAATVLHQAENDFSDLVAAELKRFSAKKQETGV